MPLFTGTQQQYYNNSESIIVSAAQEASRVVALSFSPAPVTEADFQVYRLGSQIDRGNYTYAGGDITFDVAAGDWTGIAEDDILTIVQLSFDEDLGNYQYITLDSIINNFIISYVGADKIIPRVKRTDILFHAQRGIQELSYDTLRSNKSQEIEIPPSLKMKLPHDYVNYVKVSYSDRNGVERLLYPARKTSNPKALLQDEDYNYMFDSSNDLLESENSDEWTKYQASSATNTDDSDKIDVQDFSGAEGRRYGINPETAQVNGIFYIDQYRGFIHFSSGMNGKTIKLQYISDGVGTEAEKLVHKFAEEAIYKWIAHAVLSTRTNIPEYVVARFKKERYAAIRNAKLRLSNLKLEELTQIMRGKSKTIKN